MNLGNFRKRVCKCGHECQKIVRVYVKVCQLNMEILIMDFEKNLGALGDSRSMSYIIHDKSRNLSDPKKRARSCGNRHEKNCVSIRGGSPTNYGLHKFF